MRGGSSAFCRSRETEAEKTENTENTGCLLLRWPLAKRSPSPAATALRAPGSAAPTHPGAKLTNHPGAFVIYRGALHVPAEVLPSRGKATLFSGSAWLVPECSQAPPNHISEMGSHLLSSPQQIEPVWFCAPSLVPMAEPGWERDRCCQMLW